MNPALQKVKERCVSTCVASLKDAVACINHNNDRTRHFLFENFNFDIFQAPDKSEEKNYSEEDQNNR